MTTFTIEESRHLGVAVVGVTGEIDVATAPSLREHLAVHQAAGEPVVVVDLTGVTFLDSTALGVLVGAYRRITEEGHALRLVIVEPRILKVLEITDLISVFPIADTVDAAVAG